MTAISTGKRAETVATAYLQKKGFRILERNWKTRLCEIDIVAQQGRAISFFEVKYRKSKRQGTGLDYITTAKLRQMQFAAELWAQNNRWGGEMRLGAIEVGGDNFEITAFIPDCS